MKELFLEKINQLLLSENILIDEELSRHSTFRIGGKAEYFLKVLSSEELKNVVCLCREHHIPFKIIGNGSNLLFSDHGYHGVIIKNGSEDHVSFEDRIINGRKMVRVTVESGLSLPKFSKILAEHGLRGYEFAAGIPGTIGGAIVMNAGAYGGEIGDCIERVYVLDKEGNEFALKKDELLFAYRSSIIKEKEYIILSASFLMEEGEPEIIYEKMNEFMMSRKEKQPLDFPSAGSAFKRPKNHFAGKLIMEAGLAGYHIGGAEVSKKHCGFVINTGDATAGDVQQLLTEIIAIVKRKSGIELEAEIEFVDEC